MEKKKLLILGCGWAGKITARLFLDSNFEVWGSNTEETSMEDLEKMGLKPINGLQPLLIDFSTGEPHDNILSSLSEHDFDLVVISVPVRRNEVYQECLAKFNNVIAFLSNLKAKQVVYLSSIGVYEDRCGTISEQGEVIVDGNICRIEEYLKDSIEGLVVLRLGGLFGFGRIPGHYFSNKTILVGNEKANYVHGSDVASAIYRVYDSGISNETFNVVSPIHPFKKDVYSVMAKKYNFLPVICTDVDAIQKEVSSNKIMELIDFSFRIPSPLDF